MAGQRAMVEHVSQDIFPGRKKHPQSKNDFVELGIFAKDSSQAVPT
jgi:hypothetical protein